MSWKSHLNDLATQNLRSKGSSNFTPDDDTGRISSGDGSIAGGGDDEDDIFSFQNTVLSEWLLDSLIHYRALISCRLKFASDSTRLEV